MNFVSLSLQGAVFLGSFFSTVRRSAKNETQAGKPTEYKEKTPFLNKEVVGVMCCKPIEYLVGCRMKVK